MNFKRNEQNMKRLLCIVGSMNTGGAETFLMKLYRALDKSKYQMDFCVSIKEKGFYDDEITSLGGKMYYVPPKTRNPLINFIEIKKLVSEEKYKYVMRIGQNSMVAFDLLAAWLGGAERRILRSSNSNTCGGSVSNILHKLFSFMPKLVPNVKIAPSTEAAEFVFGKNATRKGKVVYLKNAISVETFSFDERKREQKRKELGLEDKFTVGHVGRLTHQKNHKFLLNVFAEILKKLPDSVLFLVGDGELRETIEKQAKDMNILNNIKFLGVRSDIPELLSSMDVMVFTSFYEGMPNTVIEAQASGLPCVISDSITKEANITGLVEYLSLEESAELWSQRAIEKRDWQRKDYSKEFSDAGYNISASAKYFEQIIFEQ